MAGIKVFISYSHDNEIWLTEWLDPLKQVPNPKCLLKQWLRNFRNEPVEFWYDRERDTGLRGGDAWRERIFEEIDSAHVAILLVTQDFVLSPFIMDEELPRILTRYRKSELEVVPILAQPAIVKRLAIDAFLQWTPGSPTSLSDHMDRSASEFEKAKIQVLEALESAIGRAREKQGKPIHEKEPSVPSNEPSHEPSSGDAELKASQETGAGAVPPVSPVDTSDHRPRGAAAEDPAGTVKAGMGQDAVIAAWGHPDRIKDESAHGVDNWLWDYGGAPGVGCDYRVQFGSGKVRKILVNKAPGGHSRWVESWSRKLVGSPRSTTGVVYLKRSSGLWDKPDGASATPLFLAGTSFCCLSESAGWAMVAGPDGDSHWLRLEDCLREDPRIFFEFRSRQRRGYLVGQVHSDGSGANLSVLELVHPELGLQSLRIKDIAAIDVPTDERGQMTVRLKSGDMLEGVSVNGKGWCASWASWVTRSGPTSLGTMKGCTLERCDAPPEFWDPAPWVKR